MSRLIAMSTYPFLKKWLASEHGRREHEATDRLASSILCEGAVPRDVEYCDEDLDGEEFCVAHVLNVPRAEFAELVYDLPRFGDLPILWAAWNGADQPTEFIVRCIDDSDIVAIDSQGFEYARYRAACKEQLPVV